MRRKRELNLLRKKRLMKNYSDFELSLLASEMNDYSYLLKSINFPKEELNIVKKNEIKEEEIFSKKEEIYSKNDEVQSNKFKKLFSFGDSGNNLQEINDKEENENEEEYEGLKPKDKIKNKKRKRK